jgi:hypothetical protein
MNKKKRKQLNIDDEAAKRPLLFWAMAKLRLPAELIVGLRLELLEI